MLNEPKLSGAKSDSYFYSCISCPLSSNSIDWRFLLSRSSPLNWMFSLSLLSFFAYYFKFLIVELTSSRTLQIMLKLFHRVGLFILISSLFYTNVWPEFNLKETDDFPSGLLTALDFFLFIISFTDLLSIECIFFLFYLSKCLLFTRIYSRFQVILKILASRNYSIRHL